MPAPNRRNVGASLAQQIGDHAGPRSIDSRRDRLVAQRSRTDAKWTEAAARLSPTERRLTRLVPDEDQRQMTLVEKAQRASGLAFRRVLDNACLAHSAMPGTPCWSIPAGQSTTTVAAVCGRRVDPRGLRR